MVKRSKVRRKFRRAGRRAARRALIKGDIKFLQYGEILIAMSSDDKFDEMIAACAAQAVKCGLVTRQEAVVGDLEWGGFLDDVDWKKLITTILPIIIMFI